MIFPWALVCRGLPGSSAITSDPAYPALAGWARDHIFPPGVMGRRLVIGAVQLISSVTSGEGPRLVLPQLVGILLLAEELMQLWHGNETSAALAHTQLVSVTVFC